MDSKCAGGGEGGIAKFQIYWGGGTSELKSTRQGDQKVSESTSPPYLFNCNSPYLISACFLKLILVWKFEI